MLWHGRYDRLFVGGEWVEPATTDTLDVVSPYTEEVVATVPSGAPADVDRAVAAARAAFDRGPWPRMSLSERQEVLTRLAEQLEQRRDEIAALVTAEMGCPITLSRRIQATGPARAVRTFLELSEQYPFSAVRSSATGHALVTREPVGVVAAIVPWNVPLMIAVLKLAPALLAGCTAVLKPSPETPLDSYLLAEMLLEAGLPPGVVNIVPADREAGEHLVTRPEVDKVAFTGSTAAGRRIASLCGNDLRRVTLELGGKSAAIILDDADLDATVESLRFGSLRNNGQICSLKTRLLVSRRREAELVDGLRDLIASMPVGDPTDESTQIGPLVSSRQRHRVEDYVRIGLAEGAEIALGGGRPHGLARGWFVEPTVMTGVRPGMRIAQEEIFGPVLAVLTYDDEEEAVAMANDSEYGLNGAVFTTDLDRGLSIARRIRTGTVELNGNPAGQHAPMGGFKGSGIGREFGPEGFDAFVELKSIGLPEGLAGELAALP
ncbi:aldehyde dehydrogenase [Saccharomonospora sp. NPDC046836]|uniref:aldehyde dehydrogenase n=1 Tax=Saccharomonospora sp. NPDC046836 TaxID=3156921 RepID=UPI0033F706BD